MKDWTTAQLIEAGYKIENCKISFVDLSMADHGCITLSIGLEGAGWGVVYGGRCLGYGYLGAENFDSSPNAMEYIMRIMDVVGCERFNSMGGKYIRVATKGWGSKVDIIGNVIEDKWFDQSSFFND